MTGERNGPPPDPGRPPMDPRIRQRRAALRRRKGRRRLRVAVVAAALVVVAVAGLLALHSSLLSARVLSVTGDHQRTSTKAILAASGLDGHPPLIDVDPSAVAARVVALPFVASARVVRHWPDGVTIAVTQRTPVATMAGPAGSWSSVDGSGRTLEVLATRPGSAVELVVDSTRGSVPPAPVGGSLPPVARPGLTVCRTLPAAFVAQVVSVTVAPAGTVSLTLNSGLTVLLGTDTDLPTKYEDVASIIAQANLVGKHTIDVSVPESPTVS